MTKDKILNIAVLENVRYIRLQFTDLLGAIKNVEIPVSELESALDGKTMFDGSSIEGFVRTTETDMFLIPDLSTWLILEFEESKYGKVARLICDVNKMDNTPFEGDPRQNLKRVLKKMENLGFTSFNIGFEPEFYLFKLENNKRTLEFTDAGGYFDQSPIDGSEDVRRDIVLELENLGFQMEASHHEVGPGQHEINFRFADALKACDNLQTFKLVVKNNARKHNMHATFMAKPISSIAGSGMHANCSLFAKDVNCFVDENDELGLSKNCYHFIAGVMHHARAITAVANPTVNSYKRLTPGYEAPVYIGWSPANRSSFIRIPAARGNGTRVEVRSVDAMSNPYLALAAILEGGLDGIKNEMVCPDPIYKNLFKLTREQREELGILNLPNNLYDALKDLRKNEVIKEALGKHIVEKFLIAKGREWNNYRIFVTQWEIDEYLEKY